MNQWMNDIKHTCGFVYSFWFTCKKGGVKANRTRQKKINIVFDPDQSKWTSRLSWHEYTLKSVYSWHGDELSRTVSDFSTRLINYDS